jgi:hypothetical protein
MPLILHSKGSVAPYNPNLAGTTGQYFQPNDDLPSNGANTRAKGCQEEDHAEHRSPIKLTPVHMAPATPIEEELLTLEWATRGVNPTCLHFGIDTDACQAHYPNCLFCSNCDK